MTAQLFFLAPGILVEGMDGASVVLAGDEGRHAVRVKRMRVGEQILLADGQGLIADAVVEHAEGDELTARLMNVRSEQRPEPHFVLVQALAKGDRDLQAVEAATELGVDRIIPWQAERSIVQWRGDRAAKAHRKWVAQAEAATKQSRQALAPQVSDVVNKSGLVQQMAQARLAIVLHEAASEPLASLELPDDGEVLVIVGPEGGITPAEIEAFETAGARSVRIGSTVLRSSSAGPAALAALFARSRWS